MDLTAKQCLPCHGAQPLAPVDWARLAAQTPGWRVVEGHHLEREFEFPDFQTGLDFVNAAAAVAEAEGHHPELTLSWGNVRARIWTHAAGGLTENDFILAAKIAQLHPKHWREKMLGVGEKFPSFNVPATVSIAEGKTFQKISRRGFRGQVEGLLLLAQGLHLRLPDRDRGLRQAEREFPDRDAQVSGRQHRFRVRPPGLAPEPPGPEGPAVPDAGRHQARTLARALGILDPKDGRGPARHLHRGPAKASSASSRSTTFRSAATRRKCCACSTRCRPTNCAPATGRRAKTC